jgi:hypothetical protein
LGADRATGEHERSHHRHQDAQQDSNHQRPSLVGHIVSIILLLGARSALVIGVMLVSRRAFGNSDSQLLCQFFREFSVGVELRVRVRFFY